MGLQSLLARWEYIKACAGPGRATVLGVVALLGTIGTIRDNVSPGADIALIDWIPPLPWYAWVIAVLVLLLAFSIEGGYRVSEKLRGEMEGLSRELLDLRTPKLTVLFDPASCMGPVDVQRGDAGTSSTFRIVFLIVTNETAIPITDMQVYCENISVTSDQPPIGRQEDYRRLILGGSSFPINLSPKEKRHVGIVREIADLTSTGTVNHKWVELHIPLKCVSERTLYGREFLIDVIVHAKEAPVPRRASYVFGWRDDEFFFGERGS